MTRKKDQTADSWVPISTEDYDGIMIDGLNNRQLNTVSLSTKANPTYVSAKSSLNDFMKIRQTSIYSVNCRNEEPNDTV